MPNHTMIFNITEPQLDLFLSLFRGRQDVYARRWEKHGKSGYSPAYDFDWQAFMAFKAKGGSMREFPDKTKLPFTREVARKHVLGNCEVGIYPLLEDNTSYFIAADFDKKDWQTDCKKFLKICEEYSIPAYLERSRSGSGGHVWIFFMEAYPATRSRRIVLELIRRCQKTSDFDKELSFDRLFPNQDYHSQGGFGNLIALPLQGKNVKDSNGCFINPKTFKAIPDQWKYLKSFRRLKAAELDALYQKIFNQAVVVPSSRKNDNQILEIIIRNQIFLRKSDLCRSLTHFLRESLNFFNSEYLTKKKLGKSVYKTEKYFKTIEETAEEIMIPRGFVADLIQFCQEQKLPYKISDERTLLKKITFSSNIKLRGYQSDALETTEEKDFGVIVSPPGSGKTVMGLDLVVRKSQPTLILVHRKQLLDQWVERIQSFLKIPKKEIGIFAANKKKWGKKITVATMQSLARMEKSEELKNTFGLIIVDECHHIPAKTFREVITKLDSYYLYGLTATPVRKHNDEKLIFVFIGRILAQLDMDNVNGGEADSFPHVVVRETNLHVPFENKTDNQQLLYKIITFDSARNKMIVEDIREQARKNKHILVLTERREHIEILSLYLRKDFEVITISGEDSARSRKSKLEQIKLGHFQILISTGQFFGEGMDINHLECLFLVFPFSFEAKLRQYIGRLRKTDSQNLVFDYRDPAIPYCESMFRKRKKCYAGFKRDKQQKLL